MKTFWKIVFGSFVGFLLAKIIGLIFGISLIGVLIGSTGDKKAPSIPSGESILKIDFLTPVTEQTTESFSLSATPSGSVNPNFGSTISIYSMVKAIEQAAQDPQIKVLYLTPDDPSMVMSFAAAEEIRAALVRFRDSGKPIISYSNQMTGASYYLASVSDKIMFNAYGDPMIFGMSSGVIFFKDALDKLGVDMQLIRHGKYKAAGEQFTKNDMTPENLEQNQAMIDALWGSWVDDMAASRDFTAEEFNSWVDNLELTTAQSLIDHNLVDELCYKSDVDDYFCSIFNVGSADDLKVVSIYDYAKTSVKNVSKSKEKIAVVFADGEIVVDGESEKIVSGVKFADMLSKIRRDSSIKAVVLRVNSPGGAAQGAEMINHELGLLKEAKPVIASYGDYAASGGYWISVRADRIFVDNCTLTGSIGVFSLVPSFGDALRKKIGVNVVPVNSNKHSDMMNLMRRFDSDETAYMESAIEKVYSDFTSIVAEGRKMNIEKVDELGQGRVWAGSDALKVGLADERGGLIDAIRYAEMVAGLGKDSYKIVEYPAVKTTYEKLLEGISTGGVRTGRMSASSEISPISAFDAAYSRLKESDSFTTMARMPYIYNFR